MTQQPEQWGSTPQGGWAPQDYPGQPPQSGYPGQAPPPDYFGQVPPPGYPGQKDNRFILLMVGLGVVALIVIGAIILAVSPTPTSDPPLTITPTTSAPTYSPSAGDTVEIARGVKVTLPAGWSVSEQDDSSVTLTNGSEVFGADVTMLAANTDPVQAVDAFLKSYAENSSAAKVTPASPVDLGINEVNVAMGSADVVFSTSQGSAAWTVYSVISVRKSDGLAVVASMTIDETADSAEVDRLIDVFSNLTVSMIYSQARA